MELSSRECNDNSNSKQSPNYSINTSHLENIKCPKCKIINSTMDIYCKNCKSLLPYIISCKSCNTPLAQNRKCKKCGANMDQQLSYCPECGTDTLMETKEVTITTLKYNKVSYILGLIGSIIGAAVFLVALALTMKFIYNKDLSNPFRLIHKLFGGQYRCETGKLMAENILYIIPVLLCLISFLTGFTGSIRANQYDESSRKLFFISSALSVICIFFNVWYIPVSGLILLTAGILNLFKTTETRTIRTRINNY